MMTGFGDLAVPLLLGHSHWRSFSKPDIGIIALDASAPYSDPLLFTIHLILYEIITSIPESYAATRFAAKSRHRFKQPVSELSSKPVSS